MRSEGIMILAQCSHCGAEFWKRLYDYFRKQRIFCSRACYMSSENWQALGRLGTEVARTIDQEKKFLRSQKAGLARARNLSKERLREIALQGVAARLARSTPEKRSASASKAAQISNLKRWGRLPRTNWAYALSPAFTKDSDDSDA